MSDKKLTCLECGQAIANTSNVLARHIRSAHTMEWADYVVKHEHGGVWPTCACGCGDRVEWRKGGFAKYVKGHDGRAPLRVTVTSSGWVVNPFTGREERIDLDEELALLEHCAAHNDPVTHDHGFRIPWEDSGKTVRLMSPAFKHLKQRTILMIDTPSDIEYNRRLAGVKAWCLENKYAALILRRLAIGFEVVGGFDHAK